MPTDTALLHRIEQPLKTVDGIALVAAKEVAYSLFRNGATLTQPEEDDLIIACKRNIGDMLRRTKWFSGIQPKR